MRLSYPVTRYGHFYSDLESRGIFIPLTYDKKKNVVALQADNKLIFQINDFIIGESGYWYYNSPKRYRLFMWKLYIII